MSSPDSGPPPVRRSARAVQVLDDDDKRPFSGRAVLRIAVGVVSIVFAIVVGMFGFTWVELRYAREELQKGMDALAKENGEFKVELTKLKGTIDLLNDRLQRRGATAAPPAREQRK
jgi:hypothetical protein